MLLTHKPTQKHSIANPTGKSSVPNTPQATYLGHYTCLPRHTLKQIISYHSATQGIYIFTRLSLRSFRRSLRQQGIFLKHNAFRSLAMPRSLRSRRIANIVIRKSPISPILHFSILEIWRNENLKRRFFTSNNALQYLSMFLKRQPLTE